MSQPQARRDMAFDEALALVKQAQIRCAALPPCGAERKKVLADLEDASWRVRYMRDGKVIPPQNVTPKGLTPEERAARVREDSEWEGMPI